MQYNTCPACGKQCRGETCYRHSEKGLEAARRAQKKYQQTDQGKETYHKAIKTWRENVKIKKMLEV